MAELILHTLNPQVERPASLPAPGPYERIVGVTTDGNETIWEPNAGLPAPESPDFPDRTTAHALEVPTFLAVRTGMFFLHRVIGGKDFFASYGFLFDYNCHSFASFITDKTPVANSHFGTRLARRVIGKGLEAAPPLQMGEHGVLGRVDATQRRKSRALRPVHSIVGLGPEDPRCLQVTSLFGYMALGTYENVLEHFDAGQETSNNRLYVRAA